MKKSAVVLQLLKRKREKQKRIYQQTKIFNKRQQLISSFQRENEQLRDELKAKDYKLEKYEVRFRQLVDRASDVIYVCDLKGNFIYTNLTTSDLIGYTQAELLDQRLSDIIHPDYVVRVSEFYEQQIANKVESTYLEFPIISKTGAEIWLGQKMTLIEEARQASKFSAIARDITSKKTADRNNSLLFLRLQTIVENLKGGILMEDENRNIVVINQRLWELFKVPKPASPFIGTNASSLRWLADKFKSPAATLSRSAEIQKNKVPVLNDIIELDDGTILERDYIPIMENGIFQGQMWHFKDVTERQRAEEEIRRNEEKYRHVFENMKLGFVEVDANWVIVRASPTFCEMGGYEEAEVIGKNLPATFTPEVLLDISEEQKELRAMGQSAVYESVLQTKTGELFPILIGGTPILDEQGKFAGSLGIIIDLREQKKLQQELEKARQAEKEFLSNMSHEIRNPMHSIIGMANLLMLSNLTPEQTKFVKNIQHSSEMLMTLVGNILDISKIEAGKIELVKTPFDLKKLIEATNQVMAPRLQSKSVRLISFISTNIPNQIIGDSKVVNQILLNLISNAIKFTEQGSIRVEAQLEEEDAEKLLLSIRVADTGIGIDKKRLDKIFDRFNQAGKVNKHKADGAGLGLSICKKLSELHGGSIQVESEYGRGSAFTVLLQFDKVLESVAPATNEIASTFTPIPLQHFKPYVLVVEDDDLNQFYLKNILDMWGFSFHTSPNGQEALRFLEKEKVDLILMDVRMPILNGYETTKRLRSMKNNPNQFVPVIALTASAFTNEREIALQVGMNYHLTKPFTPEQLWDAIQSFITTAEPGIAAQEAESEPTSENIHLWFGNNPEKINNFIQVFLHNLEMELERLQTASQKNDWQTVAKVLHKIKPTFSIVGLDLLKLQAADLEQLCKEEAPTEQIQLAYQGFVLATRKSMELLQHQLS